MCKPESDARASLRSNGGKILCQKEITDFQIIIERSGKAGTDQTVELLILFATANPSRHTAGGQEFSKSLSANLLPDTGMKNFNRAILDLAANCSDAIALRLGICC